jgi:protein phosphatase
MRKLMGRRVTIAHGLEKTLEQMEREGPEFGEEVFEFLQRLPSHLLLDRGRLVVAHAGMKRRLQGKDSERARDFALYGETTGRLDEFGMPERLNWAVHYKGSAKVVYGHTPVHEPRWFNNTINIDTGCVFGGALTALRYPEMEIVSVPAHAQYAIPGRPFR